MYKWIIPSLGIIICMGLLISCQSVDNMIGSEYNQLNEQYDNPEGPGITGEVVEPPVYIPEEDWDQYDFHELSDEEIDSLCENNLGSQDDEIFDCGWSAKAWAVSWGAIFFKLEYCGARTMCWPTNKMLYLYAEIYYKTPQAQYYTLKKTGGPSESSCVYKAYVGLYSYSNSTTYMWKAYGKHRYEYGSFYYKTANHTH